MNKYITKHFLRYIINHLKYLKKNINYIIKYLNSSNRFSTINKKIKFIKGIIIYLKSTKLYKIYKIYNTSIKFIAFLNLLLVLSFTKFQIKIEIDYIALIAFIYSLFKKLINNLGIDLAFLKFKVIFNCLLEGARSGFDYIKNYIHNFVSSIDDKNNTTTPPSSSPANATKVGGSIAEGDASHTNASNRASAPLDKTTKANELEKEPINLTNVSRREYS
jgi:hypothetical protein